METTLHISQTDKLRSLAEKPMFWFLKNQDLTQIEHSIKQMEFPFGKVYIETLGSGAKPNEDAPMILDMGKGRTLLAVLDAASSQKKIKSLDDLGVSGAFYISHLVSMGFEGSDEHKQLSSRDELSAKNIMTAINEWIYLKMRDIPGVNYKDIPTVPGMAAVMLLVDQPSKRLSLAQVADAGAISVGVDGEVKVLTPNLNEKYDRETMDLVYELVEKFNSDLSHVRQIPEAKELIRQQLADSFARKTNQKGGVGILNGMPYFDHLVYSQDIYLDGKTSSFLLYSDGTPLPDMKKNATREEMAKSLVNRVYKKNESSILLDGAKILEEDSGFSEIPRMKSKDDATIVEVRFK